VSDLRRISTGDVAIRAADDGDGRNLDGYAYRWGETTPGAEEYPGMLEGFERGAFQPAIAARAGRPWPYLDRHGGNVIGGITFNEDATGLHYSGRLLDTVAAREYAATVEVNDGVSLEWITRGVKSQRKGSTIIHQSVPRIAALAGEYVPAYVGASVALRSGGNEMEQETEIAVIEEAPRVTPLTREQISSLATDAATEVMRQYAERGSLTTTPTDPLAGYGSLGELVYAASRERSDRDNVGRPSGLRAHAAAAIARRALDDTVFTAGANAALANGNLVTQDLQRLVNAGRPAITAFGGPRSIGDIAGLTLNWPYFDGTLGDFVAAQSAEKAAITSASVDIKLGTEALLTYAGGTDISYQVIRRGSPSILDMYARIWLAAWSAVTDAAFVTELETGSVTVDTGAIGSLTITTATAHLITASLAVQAATGRPAEFLLASTTLFSALANLIVPSSTQIAGSSSADIRGLSFALGNVPIIHAGGITAGKGIVSNTLAAAWYEDGPFLASDDDVEKLGRNVAYWSLGAGARFIPAGIVEFYDVP
jgi:phage head maturation protease